MPENFVRPEQRDSITPPKYTPNGRSGRKEEIFKKLQQSAEQCKLNYSGRKELATERDDMIAELCDALELCFNYGIREQQAVGNRTVAASLFQNMQEIVTGNVGLSSLGSGDVTFWDFCQIHLTPHERERYENLKHVWTKCGRGKAFIRATLNENSLQRYLLTWLSGEEELRRYYSPWSLLLDAEVSAQVAEIVGNLNQILFALTVDTTELNVAKRAALTTATVKEEPIIYAPPPEPVAASTKNKRKVNAVERPIATANSTEDLLKSLQEVGLKNTLPPHQHPQFVAGNIEFMADVEEDPFDPIEPELEFLKQPLPDFYPENHSFDDAPTSTANSTTALEYEDKSDTSSQYSKSSSANCSNSQTALEEKLHEMSDRCSLLETRVAQLSLENRQLVRRLTRQFTATGIDPSSSLTTHYLITIPNVKLLKSKRSSSYYAYEIHITMRTMEHWVLLRRYREFYKLHKSLLKTHPSIGSVEFPPKKHFGNMNLAFVEERRQQLQIYLLNLVESLPQVEACKTKAELQKVFPFLRER